MPPPAALARVRLGSPSLLPSAPHSITICSAKQLIPSGSKVQAFGYCLCYPWKESSHVSRTGKRWAAPLPTYFISTTAQPQPGSFSLLFHSTCKGGGGHLRHRKVAVSFYASGAPKLPCNSSESPAIFGLLMISDQAAEWVGKTNLFQPVGSMAVHEAYVTASPCYPRAPTQYEIAGLEYLVRL